MDTLIGYDEWLRKPVDGFDYETADKEDLEDEVFTLQQRVSTLEEYLRLICEEAIHEWPDAENWPIIIDAMKTLKGEKI